MDIRFEFGKRVRELRASRGISQELLADLAGLDRSYISSVERGERNISIVNIQKVAVAFNVTLEHMFSGELFSEKRDYLQPDFVTPFPLEQDRLAR